MAHKTITTASALKALFDAHPGSAFIRWSRGPAMDKKHGQ